jgi:hypothetical protein
MANNQSWEFYQQPESGTDIPYALWWPCGAVTNTSGYNLSPTADTLYAVPFDQMRQVTVSKMIILVSVAGGTGAKVRLGIYSNASNSNNVPSALVLDAGEIDVTTTGIKQLTGLNTIVDPENWTTD